MAAARGFAHSLRALLEQGALVDGLPAPYHVGNPLARALRFGCVEAYRVLDEFGADFNTACQQSSSGSALVLATRCVQGRTLIPTLLQRVAFDLNSTDHLGRTIVSREDLSEA
jgi:ankyrin repeat protein